MIELFKKAALIGDVWVLWLLVAASVGSLGIMLERWWVFRADGGDFASLLGGLRERLDRGDRGGARRFAEGERGLEARVALAGLESAGKGAASAEQAMLSRLLLERSHLESGLIVLATLGNNAPFIGLFGTVLGIIKAFNDLALSGAGGSSIVMAGISSALVATAFGILVAIPAVAANNVFQTRLKKKVTNAQSLIHLLQSHLRERRAELSREEAAA
ncbi:MAG: MotA/TolQ/ExbB proton channel family protein [Elusimicrobiota bacterium]|nr:MotA/TolQ/ExbB proton channel family protein [Elusimicrobiota bacterium]